MSSPFRRPSTISSRRTERTYCLEQVEPRHDRCLVSQHDVLLPLLDVVLAGEDAHLPVGGVEGFEVSALHTAIDVDVDEPAGSWVCASLA